VRAQIDKGSPVPLYVQLKEIVRQSIEQERLAPNDRIPSETDLSAEFNISRMTVRQAIRELVREGLVYVRRGEGTFVGPVQGAQMLIKLDGFSTQMTKEGHRVRSRTLGVHRVEPADEHAAAYAGLGVRPGGGLVMIERVRYLDDEPFALERSYLGSADGAPLLDRQTEDTFSMYKYLSSERGIDLARAEHAIEPRLADERCATALQIPTGSPVLQICGTTFSSSSIPIEYLEGLYRGDRYMFRVAIAK
jgi:GntR family transcriptional regulator